MQNEVPVKTKLKDDHRRFVLMNIPDGCTIDRLCSTISSIYSIPYFSLHYLDDEGDLITITVEEELLEAIYVISKMNPPLLRLIVNEMSGPSVKRAIRFRTCDMSSSLSGSLSMSTSLPMTAVSTASSLLKTVIVTNRVNGSIEGQRFRDEFSIEIRQTVGESMRAKYNDSVPVVIQKMIQSKAPLLDKKKYLIPKAQTIEEFVNMIENYVKNKSDIAPSNIKIYIEGPKDSEYYTMNDETVNSVEMGKVYSAYRWNDQFLYVIYSVEEHTLNHAE